MSCPLLRALCKCTLKDALLQNQRRHNFNVRTSLKGARFLTTDGKDDLLAEKRTPRAGTYRSPWIIMKEELEGIKAMTPPGTVVPRETDIFIIGGGIIGSMIAYWIKNEEPESSSITIIERDPMSPVPEIAQMSLFTSEFLCNIRKYLSVLHEHTPDVQFNHQGYLLLAEEKDAEQMVQNVAMQQELGARVVLLTKAQLAEKYPWMNFDGIECGSLGLEGEGWADPWLLLRALKQKNISLGVKYVHGEVINFDLEATDTDNGVKFRVDAGVTRTKDGKEHETKLFAAINCAGAWSADVAEMASIGTELGDLATPLPIEPRKRYAFVNQNPGGARLDCPFVVDPSGLFFRREGFGGHYICGSNPSSEAEEPTIANFDVDYNMYDEMVLPKLIKRAPDFKQSTLKTAWAGYEDHNIRDQLPVIGPHPHLKNFIFASGLDGRGMQLSAGIGRGLMELIIDSKYKTINLEKFHFKRFLPNNSEEDQLAV